MRPMRIIRVLLLVLEVIFFLNIYIFSVGSYKVENLSDNRNIRNTLNNIKKCMNLYANHYVNLNVNLILLIAVKTIDNKSVVNILIIYICVTIKSPSLYV